MMPERPAGIGNSAGNREDYWRQFDKQWSGLLTYRNLGRRHRVAQGSTTGVLSMCFDTTCVTQWEGAARYRW